MRGRRLAHAVARALIPAVLAATIARRGATAQGLPAGFDQGLFEIRLARLSAVTTTVLVAPDGGVLLPVGGLLQMTGLPVRRDTVDSIVAIPRLGGPGESILDLRRHTVVRGGDTLRLAPLELVPLAGELYLASPRFADFLQARVDVDFSLLRATVSRSPPFPAEQSYAMDYRRGAAQKGGVAVPGDQVGDAPYRGGTGGIVFDWGLSTSGRDASETSQMELRSGVALAGGDLAVGALLHERAAAGQRPVDGEFSYRRVFPEQRWIRQVQVGDLVGGAGLLRSLRGVSITNAKLLRDQFFSDVPVMPTLPQGWQYEVYLNGQLVGYSDATSASPVYVPLRYGTTPVQVRMISPAGEEVNSTFLYQVSPGQLQPQRLEYTAGAGRCVGTDCRGVAYADFTYGAARWLTLESGAEVRIDSIGTSTRPQASASIATLNGWSAQLQAVTRSYSRLALRYSGDSPLALSVSAGTSEPGGGQPSFFVTTGGQWYTESQLALHIAAPSSPLRGVRLENSGSGASDGTSRLWRSTLGGDFGWGSLGVAYQADRSQNERFWGGSALLVAPANAPRPLRSSALYAFAGVNASGLRLAEGSLSLHAGREGSIVVSGRWLPASGVQAGLGYATPVGFGRLTSRLNHNAERNRRDGTISLTGSVAVDPGGPEHPAYLEQGGVGTGGVSGRVFYDVDGDGRFGPGDRPAPNVPVLVAGHRVRGDSSGFYQTWNVVPYEALRIAIDTLRSIDPSWMPDSLYRVIRATPHLYNAVDFPLVHTRELEGELVADSGVAAPAGVSVIVAERRSGAAQTTITYSDGGYYVSRLRPGEYELSIAPTSLAALHAEAVPERVRFTIAPSDSDPAIEAPAIHLRLPYVPPRIVHVDVKKCPNVPAGVPVDSLGCPIIFKEKRTITLRGVNFDLDRATLTPASIAILTPIAAALASDTSLRIEVAGHTDASGGRVHNLALSQARAETVVALFIAHGVPADHMVARGYGADRPVATNRTAAGRAANRRTELRRLDHPPPPDEYTLQLTRYRTRASADRLVARLHRSGFTGRVVDQRGYFAVRVGRLATRAEATLLLRRMRAARFAASVTVAEPTPVK